MYIIRPIHESDLDAFEEVAKKASLGLINLPKNREILKEKIKGSERSFNTPIEKPHFENYIFVLEDTNTGELGGTCGICSRMGVIEPHYYFRLETTLNPYTKTEMSLLAPVCYPIGPTEILALYLKAEFRREGLGKLLSLCRFLFIANHPGRFEDFVVAEMRGYITEDNIVPFWESFCRKFLDVSYAELCDMELESRAFIPNIIPQWPVYTTLLPKEAQEHIAKIHDKTKPAMKMLYDEGFTFTNEIDPFDGGPKIGCKTDAIASIKNSSTAIIDLIDENIDSSREMLISNTRLDFRACYGNVTILKPGLVSISPEITQALKVGLGDEIRFVKISAQKVKEK